MSYKNQGMKWLWPRTRAKVMAEANHQCVECGTSLLNAPQGFATVDHIIPRSKGGISRRPNLQAMCSPCNIRKGAN